MNTDSFPQMEGHTVSNEELLAGASPTVWSNLNI